MLSSTILCLLNAAVTRFYLIHGHDNPVPDVLQEVIAANVGANVKPMDISFTNKTQRTTVVSEQEVVQKDSEHFTMEGNE